MNNYSGELGATLEQQLASYLSGDVPSGMGLGYEPQLGYASESDSATIGAITALGYDLDTAMGAVRTAKAVAARTGAPVQAALNATVKKYIDDAVQRGIAQRGVGHGSNTLAANLSPQQAFQYEGSICVLSLSKAIAFGTTEVLEATLDKPAVVREIRFSTNDANLTLTDFKYGGNFPWIALQFPISLAHFAPGAQSYKVRAQGFPVKTTFKASIKNGAASGTLTPIMELWGTASE